MLEKLLLQCEKYPLDFLSHLSGSFPIVVGLLRYRYLTVALKLVVVFFSFYFLKESIALWLSLLKFNNLYTQNVESIYQTVLIGAVFYCSFELPFNRRLIAVSTAICTLITLFYYRTNEVSSISLSTFRLFAIILSLAYFSKVVMDMRVKNMMKHSMFWFTSGLLLYVAGTFFIMLLSEYWYQDVNKVPMDVFDKYWNSSQILIILFTLLSTTGIWFSKCDSENLI